MLDIFINNIIGTVYDFSTKVKSQSIRLSVFVHLKLFSSKIISRHHRNPITKIEFKKVSVKNQFRYGFCSLNFSYLLISAEAVCNCFTYFTVTRILYNSEWFRANFDPSTHNLINYSHIWQTYTYINGICCLT